MGIQTCSCVTTRPNGNERRAGAECINLVWIRGVISETPEASWGNHRVAFSRAGCNFFLHFLLRPTESLLPPPFLHLPLSFCPVLPHPHRNPWWGTGPWHVGCLLQSQVSDIYRVLVRIKQDKNKLIALYVLALRSVLGHVVLTITPWTKSSYYLQLEEEDAVRELRDFYKSSK